MGSCTTGLRVMYCSAPTKKTTVSTHYNKYNYNKPCKWLLEVLFGQLILHVTRHLNHMYMVDEHMAVDPQNLTWTSAKEKSCRLCHPPPRLPPNMAFFTPFIIHHELENVAFQHIPGLQKCKKPTCCPGDRVVWYEPSYVFVPNRTSATIRRPE